MFDWNDEELANIIWGEQGETEDHTVPYPESSNNYHRKKECSQETSNIGTPEQKIAEAKTEIHGKRLAHSSNFNTINDGASGSGEDSLPGISESCVAKTDQQSMEPGVITYFKKYDSPSDASKFDKQPEIFHHLDETKEQGDLIDYEWANIGSFDDFDRIFSNDDPLFGNASISNTNELWYSSKDVTSSPLKSFPISANPPSMDLENTCEPLEIKEQFVQENEQSANLDCVKTNDSASLDLQNALLDMDSIEYPGTSKPRVRDKKEFDSKGRSAAVDSRVASEIISSPRCTEKVYWPKNFPNDQKRLEERNAGKLLQETYSTLSPPGNELKQFPNHPSHSAMQACLSSGVTPQQQLHEPQSLQGQHVAYVTPSAYGDHSNAYNAMPVLSHIQFAELKKKTLLSGHVTSSINANSMNKSTGLCRKHFIMTPQEKIVKLRRRQQMQAMLAIQKQQQQFSHQVSSTSHPMAEKSSQGSEIQQVDGNDAEVDNLSALPLLYPNSPVERDDTSAISYPVEDTILYQLQDIIAKLDMRIRLCIRDSLLRLAQSAIQRNYTCETNSTNKNSWDPQQSSTENKIDNRIRYASVAQTETDTNPIDRTVAHLLFHSPLELSENYFEAPESPASTKTSYERKTSGNLSVLSFTDSSKQKQKSYIEGSAFACPATKQQHRDHLQNNPRLANSDNASNYDPADGAMEADQ